MKWFLTGEKPASVLQIPIRLTNYANYLELNIIPEFSARPVTVTERSKACTVFALSEAGIVGLNPTQGTDV
jgi:hypothetical protein